MAADLVSSEAVSRPPEKGMWLLLELRGKVLRNRLRQAWQKEPMKLCGAAASIVLIWAALYLVLVETLQFVNRSTLIGIVATPLIFKFFFLALSLMLAFSTAILCYGTLFKRPESAYLLSSPVRLRDVVIVKYLESLAMASWSLLLLGLPLMMAMARMSDEPWSFYPLFLAVFLIFIPIPGALGLLIAWVVVMVFPRTPKRVALFAMLGLVMLGAWWMRDFISTQPTSREWLSAFFDRVQVVNGAIWPHTWVSQGIERASQGDVATAGFYLLVILANALMMSMVAIGAVSGRFMSAFTKAQTGGRKETAPRGRFTSWIAEVLFAYLPRQQRLFASKDLRTFFRDPLQWSQMAILFGLLTLYVSNVQGRWLDLDEPSLQMLISWLNLTAVSLILATFTTRFVFPLVSLEGQQMWLLGLISLKRSRLVTAKFLYSLTLTALTAVVVMGASAWRLELSRPMTVTHLVCISAICLGLCGVSIGMGARMPVKDERNPARIAGGFGGTVSLLMSVGLVTLSLTAVGLMSWHESKGGMGDLFSVPMAICLLVVIGLNAGAAIAAMIIGVRHFTRMEW